MVFDLQSLIILFATFNGLILSAILFLKPCSAQKANRFLALALFLYCLSNIDLLLYELKLYHDHSYLMLLFTPWYLLLAPMFDRYSAVVCGEPATKMTKHFLPCAVALVGLLPFYLSSGEQKLLLLDQNADVEMTAVLLLTVFTVLFSHVTLMVQAAYYLLRNWRRVNRYQLRLEQHFSNIEQLRLGWFKYLLVLLCVFWLVQMLVVYGSEPVFSGWLVTAVGLGTAAIVLSMAIKAMYHNQVFFPFEPDDAFIQPPNESVPTKPQEFSEEKSSDDVQREQQSENKYANSALSSTSKAEIVKALQHHLVEEKLFSDPDISLELLSKRIGLSRNYISEVLNHTLNSNFYNYINQLRIDEAKHLLRSTDSKSVTDIMLEVGFNSKSAFYSAFKKHTGVTPTAYKTSAAC